MVFWLAGAVCVVAALMAYILSARGEKVAPGQHLSDHEIRLLEQTDGDDLIIGGEQI